MTVDQEVKKSRSREIIRISEMHENADILCLLCPSISIGYATMELDRIVLIIHDNEKIYTW